MQTPFRAVMLITAGLLVLASGCDQRPADTADPSAPGEKAQAQEKAGEEESAESQTGEEESDESKTQNNNGSDGSSTEAGALCLDACVKARQMEAMGAEAIELDCQKKCDECIAACVERRKAEAMGADGIATGCDQECANPEPRP